MVFLLGGDYNKAFMCVCATQFIWENKVGDKIERVFL